MQRTRDGYWGWVWVTTGGLDEAGFGYMYQDPMTGPNIRVVVENAWGIDEGELGERARAQNYTGSRIVRLGGGAFESFGSADNPASSLEHTKMFFGMDSGNTQGLRVLFLPRESYAMMGLPEAPDWVSVYTGEQPRNMPVPSPMHAPQIAPIDTATPNSTGPIVMIMVGAIFMVLFMAGFIGFVLML